MALNDGKWGDGPLFEGDETELVDGANYERSNSSPQQAVSQKDQTGPPGPRAPLRRPGLDGPEGAAEAAKDESAQRQEGRGRGRYMG